MNILYSALPKNTLTVIIARYFTANQHSESSILLTEERSISSSKALTLCIERVQPNSTQPNATGPLAYFASAGSQVQDRPTRACACLGWLNQTRWNSQEEGEREKKKQRGNRAKLAEQSRQA